MAGLKKILICVPDALLEEVDSLVCHENKNRSELIRDAMRLYVDHMRKVALRDEMKKGYQEMAEINLQLAEFCFEVDSEVGMKSEGKLSECK